MFVIKRLLTWLPSSDRTQTDRKSHNCCTPPPKPTAPTHLTTIGWLRQENGVVEGGGVAFIFVLVRHLYQSLAT
ncbi:hypothetical protein A7M48_22530 [Acinetobacter baumannii]|nr:hypothetical protein A7M48_22530 [Acinetobacter baumannii]